MVEGAMFCAFVGSDCLGNSLVSGCRLLEGLFLIPRYEENSHIALYTEKGVK